MHNTWGGGYSGRHAMEMKVVLHTGRAWRPSNSEWKYSVCNDSREMQTNSFVHQKSPQEQNPSLKWWKRFVSLTTISLAVILEANFITEWQSPHARSFLLILIETPEGKLIRPKASANFSLVLQELLSALPLHHEDHIEFQIYKPTSSSHSLGPPV